MIHSSIARLKSQKPNHLLFSNVDLRKLIIPLILEQTLSVTVGMADTMMISSVGEAAVSGVSLIDMVNNLFITILGALSTGGAVVTSQFIGANKRKEACNSARQLLYTVVLFTLGLSALVILFRIPLLNLLFGRIESDVMHNALIYLVISALSFPFLALYNSSAALFRSMGNSRVTFKVSVLMNLINVVGNAICVFGLKMGVAGVAIPSLISRMVAALVLYYLLHDQKNLIYLSKEKFRFDYHLVRRILSIGIPSGIENGIFQLGRVLVISIIAGFGTVQIAANGVANSLDSMGCIVASAVNLAVISVIGRCVGAKDFEQVRYYTKKLLKYAYFGMLGVNSIILTFLPWILKLYGLETETTELAYLLIMIHNGMGIFMWPAAFTLPNMLRACNDVKFTMVVSIFSMMVFRIGFSYLLGVEMEMAILGVWIAMVLDWGFRILCFVRRYRSGKWRRYCE